MSKITAERPSVCRKAQMKLKPVIRKFIKSSKSYLSYFIIERIFMDVSLTRISYTR
jgi:hypothetical protein